MNETDDVMTNSDIVIDKIMSNIPEIIILFILIIVAVIANAYFKKKRLQRDSLKNQEFESEMQQIQERKAASLNSAKKKNKLAPGHQSQACHMPQDSTLNRHALLNIRNMLNVVYGPAPSDNALCRHHQCLITEKMLCCSTDTDAYHALNKQFKNLCNPVKLTNTVVTSPVPQVSIAQPDNAPPSQGTQDMETMPQDTNLRRHFISNLRSAIEASLAQQPTDNALKRHFNALIEAELENRLKQIH